MDALYQAIRDGLMRGFVSVSPVPGALTKKPRPDTTKKDPIKVSNSVATYKVSSAKISGGGDRYHLEYKGQKWTAKRKRDLIRRARNLGVPVKDTSSGSTIVLH